MNFGESLFTALMQKAQGILIEAKLMEHGRVDIAYMAGVFDGA